MVNGLSDKIVPQIVPVSETTPSPATQSMAFVTALWDSMVNIAKNRVQWLIQLNRVSKNVIALKGTVCVNEPLGSACKYFYD